MRNINRYHLMRIHRIAYPHRQQIIRDGLIIYIAMLACAGLMLGLDWKLPSAVLAGFAIFGLGFTIGWWMFCEKFTAWAVADPDSNGQDGAR